MIFVVHLEFEYYVFQTASGATDFAIICKESAVDQSIEISIEVYTHDEFNEWLVEHQPKSAK